MGDHVCPDTANPNLIVVNTEINMFICKQGRGATATPSPFPDPVLRNVPHLAGSIVWIVLRQNNKALLNIYMHFPFAGFWIYTAFACLCSDNSSIL